MTRLHSEGLLTLLNYNTWECFFHAIHLHIDIFFRLLIVMSAFKQDTNIMRRKSANIFFWNGGRSFFVFLRVEFMRITKQNNTWLHCLNQVGKLYLDKGSTYQIHAFHSYLPQ